MPILAGLIVAEVVVIWLTFGKIHLFGTWNVGMVGLGVNVVVVVGAGLIERALAQRTAATAVPE
ncbi:hypothetical protein [Fodinicola feengrottensis]|uniref:hypothetical protein n=1 Tax=Fodinicola feengrottensis TaxID=435914 RepID=UPI002442341D|nr:hypothetical protein [Fodinicola feengrottensis]